MKVESGVATSTAALQKIKVKEEKEECSGFQQQTGASMSTATTTVTTKTITTTHSNATSISANDSTSASLGSTSSLPMVTPSVQPTPVICHPPPVLKSNNNNNNNNNNSSSKNNNNNSEPFFNNHDLKAKTKITSTTSSLSNEKSSFRDESNFDHGNENHQPSPAQKAHHTKNSIRLENKVSSRSSDNESPLSSQALQSEKDETSSSRLEETSANSSGEGNGNGNGNGSKSISAIFSGHSKLRRLLGTLVHFAMDISPDTGDTVRSLVLGLLNGAMSAEDFHSALQEATNFPLRGFVLPYLKHTLPSLQRDLNASARINNQSCVQYLRANESAVLEAVGLTPAGESVELFGENIGNGNTSVPVQYGLRSTSNSSVAGTLHSNSAVNLHHYSGTSHPTKRRASDTPYYENGILDDSPIYGKRSLSQWSNHHHHHHQHHQQQQQQQSDPSYCWYQPLHSSGGSIQNHPHSHAHGSSILPSLVQINQLSTFGVQHLPHQQQQTSTGHSTSSQMQNGSSLDDVWKNIYVMLGCISSMVDKTKQALTILQRRGCTSPANAPAVSTAAQNGTGTGNSSSTSGPPVEGSPSDRDGSIKRLYGENVAQTIRATEDKVAEVQRRAEEAVQEVKRAAVAEIQRAVAVAVAESRVTERLRIHHNRFLDSPLPQRHPGALRQSPFVRIASHASATAAEISRTASTPNSRCAASLPTDDEKDPHVTSMTGSGCWNCGRQALETCGGCGIARYCGSFCQHRDWEAGGHHANCNGLSQDLRRSSSQSPPRVDPGSGNETDSKNPVSVSPKSK